MDLYEYIMLCCLYIVMSAVSISLYQSIIRFDIRFLKENKYIANILSVFVFLFSPLFITLLLAVFIVKTPRFLYRKFKANIGGAYKEIKSIVTEPKQVEQTKQVEFKQAPSFMDAKEIEVKEVPSAIERQN